MNSNPVILVLSLAAAAGLLVSAWQLLRRKSPTKGFARDFRTLDLSRYRPMLRLLSNEDLEYPQAAVPVAGDIAARLRQRHVELFKAYLRALRADFDLLQDTGHELIAAGAASETLPEALLRAKIEFSRAMWSIRFRLIAFQLGLTGVDARPLLSAVAQAQTALQPAGARV
jgi:hypothetical protein